MDCYRRDLVIDSDLSDRNVLRCLSKRLGIQYTFYECATTQHVDPDFTTFKSSGKIYEFITQIQFAFGIYFNLFLVRIILGSSSIKEGVSFAGVRQVHIPFRSKP